MIDNSAILDMSELTDRQYHHNVVEIANTFVKKFDRPTLGNKKNPFNELLYILLSSKTPPKRYQEVYRDLRRKYPQANNLADAQWEDVAQVINKAGLQNRKAKAIVAIASLLMKKYGRVTLTLLAKMTNKDAEDFLTSLPEVNKKSARCVLMYALDRRVFPVDSHCFRIAQRLGWVSEDAQLTDRQADYIQNGVPLSSRREVHVGMVLLGRKYCKKNNPNCDDCPILKFCSTGQLRVNNLSTNYRGRNALE